MASASRALLLARLRPLPAYRVVRPLTAAGSFLPARPWLSPAVAPGTAAAGPVRCFAAPRATSSSSSPREDTAGLPSSQPPKGTVALDVTDSDSRDSEDKMISDDDSEETAAADDSGVEKSSGGSASKKRNYGHGLPKEVVILLDGCDFKHWLVVMEPPPGDPSNPDVPRDEIIDGYIATLAQVVGSVEKARKKIYSVSTRHYFAFGACISEELSYKLKELPKVRWILPDSYLDIKNKDYGGEPFINGKAVPYDPKYHEEWVRNNARDHCSGRYVRRHKMQNLQNKDVPTGRQIPNSPPSVQQTVEPHEVPPVVHHFKDNMPPPPPDPSTNNGDPPTSQHHVQGPQACDAAPGSGHKLQQCGGLVHQVEDNQDRQDNAAAGENQGYPSNHDNNLHNNNGRRQGECSCGQDGSAAAGQPPLHGASTPSHQGCYREQVVHRYYNCHVHYHYHY